MSSNVFQEKLLTIFIVAALALIAVILLLQALDINFSLNIGMKSALQDVNKSLNALTDSVNMLQESVLRGDSALLDSAVLADSDMVGAGEECNLEGLSDQEIETLTDEELAILCPELSQ